LIAIKLTTLFKIVTGANENNDLGYPMPNYVAAWKTYRTLSNEDDQIAKTISRMVSIDSDNFKILDIGPGDGRVLLRTIIRLNRMPYELTFVEPNDKFVRETVRVTNYDKFAGKIIPITRKLEECEKESIEGFDLVLCTHTAYFLNDNEIDILLGLVRKGSRLIVIFDHPDSIFSKLWQRTAPAFFQNTKKNRALLDTLDPTQFNVRKSEVSAEIGDPRVLRPEIRDLVLSMLCYSDVEDMPAEELASVNFTISEAQRESVISCVSSVYDITAN
jgi:phospholipid N-methyltransferase